MKYGARLDRHRRSYRLNARSVAALSGEPVGSSPRPRIKDTAGQTNGKPPQPGPFVASIPTSRLGKAWTLFPTLVASPALHYLRRHLPLAGAAASPAIDRVAHIRPSDPLQRPLDRLARVATLETTSEKQENAIFDHFQMSNRRPEPDCGATNTVVDVIIVNFNAGGYLVRCVDAALRCPLPVTVTVVDNGSSDESLSLLDGRFAHDKRVVVLVNQSNLGFAAANNRAVELSSAPYLLFLNPDCILGPQTLKRLVEFMDATANAGLCGCIIRDADGREQVASRRVIPDLWTGLARMLMIEKVWPSALGSRRLDWTSEPLPESPVEVEAISGALMLARRSALDEVGTLDDGYFLHCEDLDWFVRFRRHGWPIYLIPDVDALHYKGICSETRPIAVLWHKHRGMHRFFRKFQRHKYPHVVRGLVVIGIWVHFAGVTVGTMLRGLIWRRHR